MNDYQEVSAEDLQQQPPVQDNGVEYEIDGADNPQDNGTYAADAGGNHQKVLSAEEILRNKRKQLKAMLRMVSSHLRKGENARAQEARTAKSRRKRNLEKASRKKNRRRK